MVNLDALVTQMNKLQKTGTIKKRREDPCIDTHMSHRFDMAVTGDRNALLLSVSVRGQYTASGVLDRIRTANE